MFSSELWVSCQVAIFIFMEILSKNLAKEVQIKMTVSRQPNNML